MGQSASGCCGVKNCQPSAVVSINGDVDGTGAYDAMLPQCWQPHGGVGFSVSATPSTARSAPPEWLSVLAPALAGDEAAEAADAWERCGEDLRKRVRAFRRKARAGVSCRVVDQMGRRAVPATYTLDEPAEALVIVTGGTADSPGAESPPRLVPSERCSPHAHEAAQERFQCALAEVRNIWVCSDGELARRVHGGLQCKAEVDMGCMMLVDAPEGPMCIIERSFDAREDFLDCLAVFIAAARLRQHPELAACKTENGLPPPEAKLRPLGCSLQSVHISGPICQWLSSLKVVGAKGSAGSGTGAGTGKRKGHARGGAAAAPGDAAARGRNGKDASQDIVPAKASSPSEPPLPARPPFPEAPSAAVKSAGKRKGPCAKAMRAASPRDGAPVATSPRLRLGVDAAAETQRSNLCALCERSPEQKPRN